MTEVSFYLLSSAAETARFLFLCKLTEKAYREGHRVYVLCASEQQARQLDDLLWSFRAGSFVPHRLYIGTQPAEENAVLLGVISAPPGWREIVVNLSQHIPETPNEYRRIVEILDDSETCKQDGRQRYRQYQACGFTTSTHTIAA